MIASLQGRFCYTDYHRLPISRAALAIAVIADFHRQRIYFSRMPLFDRELFFHTRVKSRLSSFPREIPDRIMTMIRRWRRNEERERKREGREVEKGGRGWQNRRSGRKSRLGIAKTTNDGCISEERRREEEKEDSLLVPGIGLSCEL